MFGMKYAFDYVNTFGKADEDIIVTIRKQAGFTLVEVAIVLVIIGLLLGGILKGQELINSARVRNLADQNSGIQAAYYGFIDRYRRVPGDWLASEAEKAIGQEIYLPTQAPGTNNGRIDNTSLEAAAVWEQLVKSQFLIGGFTPATADPGNDYVSKGVAPVNAFNGALILTRNDGYTGVNPSARLNLHMGRNVPVSIARELDVKIDDGLPNTGVLRLSAEATARGGGTAFNTQFATRVATCATSGSANAAGNAQGAKDEKTHIYDIFDDDQDCPQVFIY